MCAGSGTAQQIFEGSDQSPKNEGRRENLRAPSNLRALVGALLDLCPLLLSQALKFSFEGTSRAALLELLLGMPFFRILNVNATQ